MPELPEVETIVRDLRPELVGQSFVGAQFLHWPSVVMEEHDFDDLRGLSVLEVGRRGKFINIFFERDFVVTLHLRMSGRLLVRELAEEMLPYERSRLDFEACSLRFCDIRKFGKIWLSKVSGYERLTGIQKLGPEPLEKLGVEDFKRMFEKKRGAVKKNLLDQTLIAGIGNIYADESCFYAGIRPDKETEKLTDAELSALFHSVQKALNQGIANRGTSISDYADAYGKTGRNQELLFVYGRGGEECMTCGELLIKTRVASRGTVFCKRCQK